MDRTILIAGNWKMNTESAEAIALANDIIKGYTPAEKVEVILIPPFVHIYPVDLLIENHEGMSLGAQNCSPYESGAYTGEISAKMLSTTGCTYILVGHSERRTIFGETDDVLAAKTNAVLKQNLKPIFCIGETLAERESGKHFDIVRKQMENGLFHLTNEEMMQVVIAYEPVWAIGTGKTASPGQAQEMHAFIREVVREKYMDTRARTIQLLYGGSVNAANAKELFSCPDIDGGLVGGASLKAADFLEIIKAAKK